MSLVLACGNQLFTVTSDEALIGRDAACAIALPDDDRLAARHAALRKVGGRWLIEARSDAMLQVGNNPPARLGWLNDGDVIRLTPNGPELTFNPPTVGQVSNLPATTNPPMKSGQVENLPHVAEPHPSGSGAATPRLAEQTSDRPSSVVNDWKKPIAIASAIVVGFGLLWGFVIHFFSTPNESTANNSANPAPNPESEPIAAEPPKIDKPKPVAVVAPANPTDSVYAVLIFSEDRQQIYQVGTAWAVSPKHLVTSAAVVQALESLRASLGVVLVRHPATKVDHFVAERPHPKYVELTANATQLQAKLSELDQQLAKATDATEKQSLEQKSQELDQQLITLFRETIYYDLGVLEVRDRLPHVLPRSTTPAAKGQRLRLVGVPFPEDEQLLNPERPPKHQELSGQFLATLPEIESIAPPIIFNATLKDLQGHQWSGAPIVNSAGQVVAVFSRLAPPDIKAAPDPNQLRPHATDIRALRELIP